MLSPEEKSRDVARLAQGYREWLRTARRESDAQRERRMAPRPGAEPYSGPERRRGGAPFAEPLAPAAED
jgi:hypothetical protein